MLTQTKNEISYKLLGISLGSLGEQNLLTSLGELLELANVLEESVVDLLTETVGVSETALSDGSFDLSIELLLSDLLTLLEESETKLVDDGSLGLELVVVGLDLGEEVGHVVSVFLLDNTLEGSDQSLLISVVGSNELISDSAVDVGVHLSGGLFNDSVESWLAGLREESLVHGLVLGLSDEVEGRNAKKDSGDEAGIHLEIIEYCFRRFYILYEFLEF